MANFICAFYHFLSEKKRKKERKQLPFTSIASKSYFLPTFKSNKQSKTEEQKLEN